MAKLKKNTAAFRARFDRTTFGFTLPGGWRIQ
jgi:hypothetical protein